MAAPVTLADLVSRIRFEADMRNSQRATDADIKRLVNVHAQELYDRLVTTGPPDYYLSTYSFTTTPGTVGYTVPEDFRSIVRLYVNVTSTRQVEVFEMNEGHRAAYDAPQSAISLTMTYIPTFVQLVEDSDTMDGVSGWDELVVQLCARALRARDNRDVSSFATRIDELRGRVLAYAPQRKAGGPKYITDVEAAQSSPWFWYPTLRVDAWTLEGPTLNVYALASTWP